ncbi:GP88 family protein [Kibdelosporangium phytohabitans]|uniref:GP88 family protein n=1 Tax=Kibdelosporangium phytohabitans TaxID=860235 RepID=UPI001C54D1D8
MLCPDERSARRPKRLLTQNRRLRPLGIFTWTLPALAGRFPDGTTYVTCRNAGVCSQACYALNGTYRIPGVLARHQRNLQFVLGDLDGWKAAMLAELNHSRYRHAWIRIHDSGDFLSLEYLRAWLEIMRSRPSTRFYCYTKEVSLFRTEVEPDPPDNFWWVYSLGGKQDHLLGDGDRVADVFPDEESIAAAGWNSQAASDLLAVLGPAPVGIRANNIARFRAVQAGRRWSEWQAQTDAARRAKLARHRNNSVERGEAVTEPRADTVATPDDPAPELTGRATGERAIQCPDSL